MVVRSLPAAFHAGFLRRDFVCKVLLTFAACRLHNPPIYVNGLVEEEGGDLLIQNSDGAEVRLTRQAV